MESYTDSCFRRIARSFGAEVVFTEMIPAEGLMRRLKPVLEKARFRRGERPLVGQLVGGEEKILEEAAQILEEEIRVDAIDLNFACPAKNILKQKSGGVLLKEPKKLLSLLYIVRRKTTLPLSIKIRAGFAHKGEVLEWISEAEKVGADAVILHPRTVKQKFTGKADWNLFALVKQKLSVPLIASGDIFTQKDIARLFAENPVDGVLVARGALGNPWIFENLDLLKTHPREFLDSLNKEGWYKSEPTLKERQRVIALHWRLAVEFYGEERAWFGFRPHIFWYLKEFPEAKKWRVLFGRVRDTQQAHKLIVKLCNIRS